MSSKDPEKPQSGPDEQVADDEQEKQTSKIHTEEVKQQYTSHWDLDYLPKDQVDEAYEQGSEEDDSPPASSD